MKKREEKLTALADAAMGKIKEAEALLERLEASDDPGREQLEELTSLYASVQEHIYTNIYSTHPMRRIFAFDSRRDDEYTIAYEYSLEGRRLKNRLAALLKERYGVVPMKDKREEDCISAEELARVKAGASVGDCECLYRMGMHYANFSEESPADFQRARKYFRQAAACGYAPAMSRLGDLYYVGDGVPQDDKEALRWYKKAASQGFHMAMMQAGRMYYLGRGTRQDYAVAGKFFHKVSTEKEDFFMVLRFNSLASQYLGRMHERGEGYSKDPTEALRWYLRAAEDGRNTMVRCKVAEMYLQGLGTEPDREKAIEYYRLAGQYSRDIYGDMANRKVAELEATGRN